MCLPLLQYPEMWTEVHIQCKFLHGATIMEGSVVTMYIVYEGSICMCVCITTLYIIISMHAQRGPVDTLCMH